MCSCVVPLRVLPPCRCIVQPVDYHQLIDPLIACLQARAEAEERSRFESQEALIAALYKL